MRAAAPATAEIFRLAEGPVWDSVRGRLLWVDILAGTVLQGILTGSTIKSTPLHRFEGTVGAVAAALDGTLVVAGQEELLFVRSGGDAEKGPRVVPPGAGRRLNDGATDPGGRFLVGTLSLAGPSTSETLVRLESDGSVTVLDEDLGLSNGLAWSADGRTMYSVDTLRRTVFVRTYDPSGGFVGERRQHLTLADGFPDGIAVDEADHLWVAVWGAGEVRRYSPAGVAVDRVQVPALHTSSLCFAGEDLHTMVITTAMAELDGAGRRTHPDSGRLFTARVDVPGLRVAPWSRISSAEPPD